MSNGNEEMTVSKLAAGLAKTVGNAANVAGFLDSFPPNLTIGQRNRWMMSHLGAHLAWRGTTEILAELANAPIGGQAELFDTPTDHAMAVREVEDFLDRLKEHIVGAVTSWELRVAAENEARGQQGPPDLADAVSLNVYTSAGPVTFADLEAHFGDTDGVRLALDWLVAAGKITETDAGYSPAGGELHGISGDELREMYQAEVGKKPGKKSEEALRAAILDARRTAAGA